MSWLPVLWVIANTILFAVLFVYSVRLSRKWSTGPLGSIAIALVFVSVVVLLAATQRIGIHAARAGWIGANWEEFFLTRYQIALSIAGSVAGIYALTKLRSGIKGIETGERVISALAERTASATSPDEWGLTSRELQVLRTLVSGKTSDREIAEELFISVTTAATHVRNILKKAGLSNRMDLMIVASQSGDERPTTIS